MVFLVVESVGIGIGVGIDIYRGVYCLLVKNIKFIS